jgi:hypothetical protein
MWIKKCYQRVPTGEEYMTITKFKQSVITVQKYRYEIAKTKFQFGRWGGT